MRVLSLDPALANTAAVLFENGKIVFVEVIKLPPSSIKWMTVAEKDRQRLMDLAYGIRKWVKDLKPDYICVEQSQGGAQSAMAAKALSLVAGCVYTLASEGDSRWHFIRVHDVKRAITGKARATKTEVIEEAVKRYPVLLPHLQSSRGAQWNGKAEHIADAVAVYEAFRFTEAGRIVCKDG